jgi:pre-mRNA-splicing factor ATP-dependent RNA helicase DHX15/PRP43
MKRKLDLGAFSLGNGDSREDRSSNAAYSDDSKVNPWTAMPYSGKYYEILAKRKLLPVYDFKEDLISKVKANQVIVVEGETGSGKTTQIPQFLLPLLAQPGRRAIACTQPRRVAAMSIAKRVSEEMDVQMGEQVGYTIRFEDCTSTSTILKFMTDGMLLREAMHDPKMERYRFEIYIAICRKQMILLCYRISEDLLFCKLRFYLQAFYSHSSLLFSLQLYRY